MLMISDCVFNETRSRSLTFPAFQISPRAEISHVMATNFSLGCGLKFAIEHSTAYQVGVLGLETLRRVSKNFSSTSRNGSQ